MKSMLIYELSSSYKHLPMPPSAVNDFQLLQPGVELTLEVNADVLCKNLCSNEGRMLDFYFSCFHYHSTHWNSSKQTEKQKQFLYFLVEEHACMQILSHLS